MHFLQELQVLSAVTAVWDNTDVAQQHCQLLPLPSLLPLSMGPVLHPPHGTTTAPKVGMGNLAGLKITFSFAELFLTQISSPIQVTMLLQK